MTAPKIFYLLPDDDTPCGGFRVAYRHVDILNAAGHWASVLHQDPGFRCTWFANETRVSYNPHRPAQKGDILVMPEVLGPDMASVARGTKKVIFNQNAYLTFEKYPLDGSAAATPYTDPDVLGAIVVSEDSKAYLEHAFPSLTVHRVHDSIDPGLFRPAQEGAGRPAKKRQICFMPRKHPDEAAQVFNILRFRGALDGFDVVAIEGLPEAEVARIMGESMLFFSFGYPEGFSLPPAEAMACGCVVVGYHGFGGREYLTRDVAYPVEPADVQEFVIVAEPVLGACRNEDPAVMEKAQLGMERIRTAYSPEIEAADVAAAWETLLEGAR